MKTLQFTPAQAAVINQMCELMMQMNNDKAFNGKHAGSNQTYGAIHNAVVEFIAIETGLKSTFIENAGGQHGWNLYGNANFAVDIQTAINASLEEIRHTEASEAQDILWANFRESEDSLFEIEGQGDPEFYWIHCTLGDLESTIPATIEAAQEFITSHKA